MMPKTETSRDDAAEKRSNPVNWEEDTSFKAKRREEACWFCCYKITQNIL